MAGNSNISAISAGAADAAATFNTPIKALEANLNHHLVGDSTWRTLLAEIDSPILNEQTSITAVTSTATDLGTRFLQLLTVLDRIMDGNPAPGAGATTMWTKYAALTGTQNLVSLDTAVAAISANNWVTTARITDGAVTSAKILDGTIATGDIADSAITSAKILDGTIVTADIADSAITSAKILDGTIATADIADSAITSVKILDGTIVTADIADSAITSAKILDGTIATGDIAAGAITSALILDGTIVTADIADSAITSAKILDGTIATGDIAALAVTTALLADSAVTSAKILDGTIVGADVADRSLSFIKMQELAMSGTGTTMVLTFNGGSFQNSSGVLVNAGSTTITPAATASNQYIPYYLNDSGTLTAGTVGPTQATASIPTSSATPVQTAFVPANCTAIYSSLADWQAGGSLATKGYLLPRPVGISGNATASGIQTTATLATIGAAGTSGDTSGVNLVDVLQNNVTPATINGVTFAAGGQQGPNIIRTAPTDAGLDAMLAGLITPSYELAPATAVTASGTTITVAGGGGFLIAGRWVANALPITLNATTPSAATGMRYLFADRTNAGVAVAGGFVAGGFTVVQTATAIGAAPPAPTANQRLIAVVLYDSATGCDAASIDFSPLSLHPSTQLALRSYRGSIISGSQVLSTTGYIAISSPACTAFPKFTKATACLVLGSVTFQTVSAAQGLNAQICSSAEGASVQSVANGIGQPASHATAGAISLVQLAIPADIVTFNAGRYAVGPMAALNNAGSATIYAATVVIIPIG